jgi:formate hydrogenlyase subunit 4
MSEFFLIYFGMAICWALISIYKQLTTNRGREWWKVTMAGVLNLICFPIAIIWAMINREL